MKEELISFETAKLAKKKGFTANCENVYYGDIQNKLKVLVVVTDGMAAKNSVTESNLETGIEPEPFEAPTQSLLQKWLREKHNLNVTVDIENEIYKSYVRKGLWNPVAYGMSNDYEKAFEAGLKSALELIKDYP